MTSNGSKSNDDILGLLQETADILHTFVNNATNYLPTCSSNEDTKNNLELEMEAQPGTSNSATKLQFGPADNRKTEIQQDTIPCKYNTIEYFGKDTSHFKEPLENDNVVHKTLDPCAKVSVEDNNSEDVKGEIITDLTDELNIIENGPDLRTKRDQVPSPSMELPKVQCIIDTNSNPTLKNLYLDSSNTENNTSLTGRLTEETYRILQNEISELSILSAKISKIFEANQEMECESVHNSNIPEESEEQLLLPGELCNDGQHINDKASDDNNPCETKKIERTLSSMEKGILLRGEILDSRKATVLQLPQESIPYSASRCEREIMGDDHKKTTAHILCECDHPGVLGGAVPIVTSFTMSNTNVERVDDYDLPDNQLRSHIGKGNSSKPQHSHMPKLFSSIRNSLTRTDKNENQDSSTKIEKTNDTQGTRNICFKTGSEDTIQSTASLVKEVTRTDNNGQTLIDKQDEELVSDKSYKRLTNEFSKQISRLAEEASYLSEIRNPNTQLNTVHKLYKYITNLKKIANELKTAQEPIVSSLSQKLDQRSEPPETSKSKNRDNRIYIKFLPSKLSFKRRKSCNSEAQANEDNLNQDTKEKSRNETQNSLKEADSFDGMFIPSYDEPPIMEEDDEDGLDITITFPESQKTMNQETDSHLSVCFSNISAEALGRLKRCPKEFTLRMDFVQGKVFFQSGKSGANNFAIGPDLKIIECPIDNKESDIINIKPSTECLYASQIIPVEGATRKESIKILKSTDSELFSVVSLPFVNRRITFATNSCMSLKKYRRYSETSLQDRTYYRSMPQIPSLTKIIEDSALDTVASGLRTAIMNNDKKPRTRMFQKKRINASADNILNFGPT